MDRELPLSGHKILITRSEEQAFPLVQHIEEYGGEAIVIPLLSFQPPQDLTPIRRTIHEIQHYQWIVFTSQNTVRFFVSQLEQEGYSVDELNNHKIAAIGKKTVQLLEKIGLKVDFFPSQYVAEQFTKEFIPYTKQGDRILLPQGNLARTTIKDLLSKDGRYVKTVTTYETVPDFENKIALNDTLKEDQLDVLTFTSSSSVHFFFQLVDAEFRFDGKVCACIGPVTALTLEDYGLTADVIAEEYTIDGLIRSIGSYLQKEEQK